MNREKQGQITMCLRPDRARRFSARSQAPAWECWQASCGLPLAPEALREAVRFDKLNDRFAITVP